MHIIKTHSKVRHTTPAIKPSAWRSIIPLVGVVCICLLTIILLMQPGSEASALPEYSVQTGEPCASCHISPSGGGPRGPRGQAWVGEGKPGAVPGLIEALEALGVHLEVDPAYYQLAPEAVEPARPLGPVITETEVLHNWLITYEGN